MATITSVINVCDRCGSRHDTAKYMADNEWGQLNLSWIGDKGGRSWQGDAGGVNLKGKAWLCMKCTDAFFAFMAPPQAAAGD